MPHKHVVKQGEYLAGIARKYGFADWHKIYDDPANADFRQRRPDPNVIRPGDRIVIPDKDQGPSPAATGKRSGFRVKPAKRLLRMKFQDADGKALAGEPYVLLVGAVEYTGTTGGDGLLEQEIAGTETEAELRFDALDLTFPLGIGHLDPIDDGDEPVVTGAQARLNNLGYHCGEVDGEAGPRTRQAVRSFQQTVLGREDADGELDQETRDALKREHGC